MKCKSCLHYGQLQMITGGAYSYSGRIYCLTCQEYNKSEDNYESIPKHTEPEKEGEWCECKLPRGVISTFCDKCCKPIKSLSLKSSREICKHCGGEIAIRNPKGYCDHLHYPENCEVCRMVKSLPSKPSDECWCGAVATEHCPVHGIIGELQMGKPLPPKGLPEKIEELKYTDDGKRVIDTINELIRHSNHTSGE